MKFLPKMNSLFIISIVISSLSCLIVSGYKIKAVCNLRGQNVQGTVNLEQEVGYHTKIQGEISGLSPGSHGFHIHEFGDISTLNCSSAGPHYNPRNNDHGSPSDNNRHVGDLGNIEADQSGKATFDFDDSVIMLSDSNSVIGRSIVVHADPDDLGRGGHESSKTTGNAGGRLACCVIEIAK
ncbi:superoxide dismutase [Cu-Zn]-like [Panonychus citri]|uniref:superoxide dismutase [Cu-Zn]-like n=1 Tax=Panonychus citri TaxID=50023 RepID=UPI002308357C|nr:superoxide dismutase [Cu-Zn]-like [Panonychus citri]